MATLWDLPYNLNFASELEWVLPTEHTLHVTTFWDLPCDLNLASAITLLIAQLLALVGFSITKSFTGSFAFEFVWILMAWCCVEVTIFTQSFTLKFTIKVIRIYPTGHFLHVATFWDLLCDMNFAFEFIWIFMAWCYVEMTIFTWFFTLNFAIKFIWILPTGHF